MSLRTVTALVAVTAATLIPSTPAAAATTTLSGAAARVVLYSAMDNAPTPDLIAFTETVTGRDARSLAVDYATGSYQVTTGAMSSLVTAAGVYLNRPQIAAFGTELVPAADADIAMAYAVAGTATTGTWARLGGAGSLSARQGTIDGVIVGHRFPVRLAGMTMWAIKSATSTTSSAGRTLTATVASSSLNIGETLRNPSTTLTYRIDTAGRLVSVTVANGTWSLTSRHDTFNVRVATPATAAQLPADFLAAYAVSVTARAVGRAAANTGVATVASLHNVPLAQTFTLFGYTPTVTPFTAGVTVTHPATGFRVAVYPGVAAAVGGYVVGGY